MFSMEDLQAVDAEVLLRQVDELLGPGFHFIPTIDGRVLTESREMWFAYDALSRCDRPFTGKHYDLARQISSYWANFIRSGDPNGMDTAGYELPRWEKFTKDNDFMMLFRDIPMKSPKVTDKQMKRIIFEKTGLRV